MVIWSKIWPHVTMVTSPKLDAVQLRSEFSNVWLEVKAVIWTKILLQVNVVMVFTRV